MAVEVDLYQMGKGEFSILRTTHLTIYVFLSGSTPVMVRLCQFAGRVDFTCIIPLGVISNPPNPIITLCNMPPAPVAKYGLVPPFASAMTLNGGLRVGRKG